MYYECQEVYCASGEGVAWPSIGAFDVIGFLFVMMPFYYAAILYYFYRQKLTDSKGNIKTVNPDKLKEGESVGEQLSRLDTPELKKTFGFFYKSYERKFFWFEVAEMLKKFVLVAGLALLPAEAMSQLFLATFITFIYLVLVLNFAPFKKDDADLSNQVTNIQIFMTLLVGLAMKSASKPKIGSISAIMIDAILSFSNTAVIVLGGATMAKCVGKKLPLVAKGCNLVGTKIKAMRDSKKGAHKIHPVDEAMPDTASIQGSSFTYMDTPEEKGTASSSPDTMLVPIGGALTI